MKMNPRNTLSLLARRLLDPFEARIVNLAPTKVRGLDPLRDLRCLLDRKSDPVIFDVGANDGETVTEFLQTFPRASVVAFDPYGPCCDILHRRFDRDPRVHIQDRALGSAQSSGQLNLYSGDRMNSLLRLDAQPGNIMAQSFASTGSVEVAVDTLDAFCREHSFTVIDVLKVDTQGYDLEVLKGATDLLADRRIKTVMIEVNFVPMYEEQTTFPELHGLLTASGYRLVDFYNQHRDHGYTAWCDACYTVADRPAVGRRA